LLISLILFFASVNTDNSSIGIDNWIINIDLDYCDYFSGSIFINKRRKDYMIMMTLWLSDYVRFIFGS